MVIDHADSLHVGVANGATDKPEAAFAEVSTHGVGLLGGSGDLRSVGEVICLGHTFYKLPDVFGEGPELALRGEEGLRIGYCALNLQSVSNDARVCQQGINLDGLHVCDLVRIKLMEDFAIVFSFAEDCDPRKTSLRPFQNQKLE